MKPMGFTKSLEEEFSDTGRIFSKTTPTLASALCKGLASTGKATDWAIGILLLCYVNCSSLMVKN